MIGYDKWHWEQAEDSLRRILNATTKPKPKPEAIAKDALVDIAHCAASGEGSSTTWRFTVIENLTKRILDTMNGSHELTADQRAELQKPEHAQVRALLDDGSPAMLPEPPATPTDVAGGGAGLRHPREYDRNVIMDLARACDWNDLFDHIDRLRHGAWQRGRDGWELGKDLADEVRP